MLDSFLLDDHDGVQVAAAGEALMDLIANADGQLQPCFGGAPFNLTLALARQGVGTLYLNPMSKDPFGLQLAAVLKNAGVYLAESHAVLAPTSLAVVNVDPQGVPTYAFYRQGVADRATSAAKLMQACAKAENLSLVCTGGLALSPDDAEIYLPWLAGQRQSGRTVVIDANMRPSLMPNLDMYRRHVLTALHYADIIKVSDGDLACLHLPGPDAMAQAIHLLQYTRASILVLTQGAKGAALLTRHGQLFQCREVEPITVVDTVGAGDCFLAGLVSAVVEDGLAHDWGSGPVHGDVAKKLLARAVSSASLCVLHRGCVPPTLSQVIARQAKVAMLLTG